VRERTVKVLQLCAVDRTAEAFLLPLIDRLTAEDYDVHILCSYGPRTERLRKQGYKIKNIEITRRIRPLSHFMSLIRVYRYIRKEKFDIVHAYTPIAGVIGRVAAKLAGVPIIIFTSLGFYFHENMTHWKWRSLILFERLVAKFADFIFTVSIEDEKTAIEERIAPPSKLMGLNGIGIDTHRFDSKRISEEVKSQRKKELGIRSGDKVIGFIGRIVREKGIIDLIEALAKIKRGFSGVKLMIIGDDTIASERDSKTKGEAMALIEQHDLGKDIAMTGFVEDLREFLAILDVFVLPSYREGMPKSILEAMAMSKPVVATDIRGCREEVADGETGFLVPVGDPERLAEAILKLLKDEKLAQEMGDNGRRRVEQEFDQELVLEKQVEVYRRVIQERLKRK